MFLIHYITISISADKRHGPRPREKRTASPHRQPPNRPKGGVINVVLSDPSDLTVDGKSGYLWS